MMGVLVPLFPYCAVLFIVGAFCAPTGDLISNLPGANFPVNFQQYSGYLQASPKHFIHYWLMFSQNSPSNDPVLLWLNGGPGCSSILGLMEENGPFRIINNGSTVVENVYSWNKIANVLYLESPVGVGYSYTTDGNYNANDDITATDNYHALVDFFTNKFPELKSHAFFISGESYAGYYIPMLGKLIVQDPKNFPNFKGMAIGNGLLNYPLLVNTLMPMLYQHGLISERQWQSLGANCCNGNPNTCDYYHWFQRNSSACFYQVVQSYIIPFQYLDPYNLYATCYFPTSILLDYSKPRGAFYKGFFKFIELDFANDILLPFSIPEHTTISKNIPLCAQVNNTVNYMNRPDVRSALHIPSNVGPWATCNKKLNYTSEYGDTVSQVKAVMSANKRILIYNGDLDTACNGIGDQMFVSQLNATLIKPKSLWTYANGLPDSAGLVTQYQGIDFATVRGAGHLVPKDKPREALQLIANFIWNKPYSTPTGINVVPQPLLGGYCNQIILPPNFFGGSVKASALCGNGGVCMDTTNGAVCSCAPGFSGKFCTKYVPFSKSVPIQLCAAYPTSTTKAQGLLFGCPQTYTCVPYQYRCVTTLSCNYPIGYCLPWVHVNTMFPSMSRKLRKLETRTARAETLASL